MKKVKKPVIISIFIGVIAILIVILIVLICKIHDLSFVEGRVVNNSNGKGGIITVSNDWTVYTNDNFIKGSNVEKSTVKDFYCEFHQNNLMKAAQESYSKLSYTKIITIEEDGNIKKFYLVGSYYITSPDKKTSKS